MVIILPICYVRNIKIFSIMHLIGDIAVLCTVFALGYSAIYDMANAKDYDFRKLKMFNNEWYKILGMCITSLEGIGVLLPIKVRSTN